MLSSPKKKTLIDFHDCCNAVSVNIIGAHTSSQAPVKLMTIRGHVKEIVKHFLS